MAENSGIPYDIIRSDILTRLPCIDLMRLKCVSKNWNSMISDLATTLFGDFGRSKAVFMSVGLPDYCAEKISHNTTLEAFPHFHFIDGENSMERLSWDPVKWFPWKYTSPDIYIAGSCNGLLLINHDGSSFSLWNPCTNYLSHVLELEQLDYGYDVTNHGICYDWCTDEYKVVVGLFNRESYTPKSTLGPVLVSGLRNKGWKQIHFPYFCDTGMGVLFNGFLHWVVVTSYDLINTPSPEDLIVSFDPTTNQVRELPVPPQFRREKGSKRRSNEKRSASSAAILGLGVLDGCLCMACCINEVVQVMVMKQYGIGQSWTLLFETPNLEFTLGLGVEKKLIPVMQLKNGQVLLSMNGKPIIRYDPDQAMEYSYDFEGCGRGWPHIFIESANSPAGLEWDYDKHEADAYGGYDSDRSRYSYNSDETDDLEWAEY